MISVISGAVKNFNDPLDIALNVLVSLENARNVTIFWSEDTASMVKWYYSYKLLED